MPGAIVIVPPVVDLPPGTTSGGTSILPPFEITYAIPIFPQTWTALQTYLPNTLAFLGTGGTSQVVMQESLNGPLTVRQLRASDIGASSQTIITAAGPYVAQPSDNVLIIKQAVGAPFTVTVDWSARTRPLQVVDGKGDAATNNITITPAAGQTQLAIVNFSYVIDGNGGSVILTPLPDGSGAY